MQRLLQVAPVHRRRVASALLPRATTTAPNCCICIDGGHTGFQKVAPVSVASTATTSTTTSSSSSLTTLSAVPGIAARADLATSSAGHGSSGNRNKNNGGATYLARLAALSRDPILSIGSASNAAGTSALAVATATSALPGAGAAWNTRLPEFQRRLARLHALSVLDVVGRSGTSGSSNRKSLRASITAARRLQRQTESQLNGAGLPSHLEQAVLCLHDAAVALLESTRNNARRSQQQHHSNKTPPPPPVASFEVTAAIDELRGAFEALDDPSDRALLAPVAAALLLRVSANASTAPPFTSVQDPRDTTTDALLKAACASFCTGASSEPVGAAPNSRASSEPPLLPAAFVAEAVRLATNGTSPLVAAMIHATARRVLGDFSAAGTIRSHHQHGATHAVAATSWAQALKLMSLSTAASVSAAGDRDALLRAACDSCQLPLILAAVARVHPRNHATAAPFPIAAAARTVIRRLSELRMPSLLLELGRRWSGSPSGHRAAMAALRISIAEAAVARTGPTTGAAAASAARVIDVARDVAGCGYVALSPSTRRVLRAAPHLESAVAPIFPGEHARAQRARVAAAAAAAGRAALRDAAAVRRSVSAAMWRPSAVARVELIDAALAVCNGCGGGGKALVITREEEAQIAALLRHVAHQSVVKTPKVATHHHQVYRDDVLASLAAADANIQAYLASGRTLHRLGRALISSSTARRHRALDWLRPSRRTVLRALAAVFSEASPPPARAEAVRSAPAPMQMHGGGSSKHLAKTMSPIMSRRKRVLFRRLQKVGPRVLLPRNKARAAVCDWPEAAWLRVTILKKVVAASAVAQGTSSTTNRPAAARTIPTSAPGTEQPASAHLVDPPAAPNGTRPALHTFETTRRLLSPGIPVPTFAPPSKDLVAASAGALAASISAAGANANASEYFIESQQNNRNKRSSSSSPVRALILHWTAAYDAAFKSAVPAYQCTPLLPREVQPAVAATMHRLVSRARGAVLLHRLNRHDTTKPCPSTPHIDTKVPENSSNPHAALALLVAQSCSPGLDGKRSKRHAHRLPQAVLPVGPAEIALKREVAATVVAAFVAEAAAAAVASAAMNSSKRNHAVTDATATFANVDAVGPRSQSASPSPTACDPLRQCSLVAACHLDRQVSRAAFGCVFAPLLRPEDAARWRRLLACEGLDPDTCNTTGAVTFHRSSDARFGAPTVAANQSC